MRALKIDFIGAQESFSTLHRLASLQRQNSRFALRQLPLLALHCDGRVPEKHLNRAA
jgi:hypothetical protein